MKRYIAYICYGTLYAAALLTAGACSDYIDVEDIEGKPIRLAATNAYIPTRAATDLQGPVFDEGAEVSVFIKGTTATQTTPVNIDIDYPTVFTASAPKGSSGSKYNDLTPIGNTPHYLTGSESKVSIMGTYPVITSSTFEQDPNESDDYTFTVKDDQTSDDDYKVSDLMLTGVVNHDKNNEVVNLPFEHKMAKIIISAIGEPGITMDDEIVIGSTTGSQNGAGVYRSVKLDMTKADYKTPLDYSTNAGLSNRGQIKMTNGGAILIPPQTVTTADFIIATGHTSADPTTREAHFSITTKTFEAGKVYKLTLAISADNFTLPEAITGWTDNYGELTLMPSGGYAGVTIDDMPAVTYSGTEYTPKPDVWYGTDELTKIKLREGSTKDFVYNYVDNKNAGHAQVLVIGQNYYAGLAAVHGFVIKKRLGKISFPEGTERTGDDGTGIEFEQNLTLPAIKALNTAYDPDYSELKADGVVTYSAEDASGNPTNVIAVDAVDGTVTIQNVGTAYVRATVPLGSPNTYDDGKNFFYTDGTQEGTTDTHTDRYKVVVKAKPATAQNFTVTYDTGNDIVIANQTIDASQYFVYNGKDQQLVNLTVSDGEYTLARDIDYEAVLTNSQNRGNALLTITGKKNYNATFTKNIPVLQATPTIEVDQTMLTMGIHQSTAPKNRRKSRVATTESWAAANLQYSLSPNSKLQSNSIISINDNGLITGLSEGTSTVYVDVLADASENGNWKAATQKSFTVTVVNSDFDFNFSSANNYGKATSGTLNTTTKHVVYNAAYSEWVCPASGTWQIDCYGAQGANTPTSWDEVQSKVGNTTVEASANHFYLTGSKIYPYNRGMGGRGAHIAGRIYLKKGQKLYICVGEQGKNVMPGEYRNSSLVPIGKYQLSGYAWNGGGNVVWGALRVGGHSTATTAPGYYDGSAIYNQDIKSSWSLWYINSIVFPISGGGGATDVSLSFGTYPGGTKMVGYNANTAVPALAWKSPAHLYSRILVAGGGGGALYYDSENDGKGFADGGDGGAWKGGDGVFNDIGYGGQMNQGGFGGSASNWYLKNVTGSSTLDHSRAIIYDDGPYAGGFSCYDGMFGEGGGYTMTMQGNGCGGGGWYGGGAGGESGANGSGAGGSSFMWTDKVSETDRNGANSKPLYQYYTTTAESGLYAKDNSYFAAPATKYPGFVPSTNTNNANYIPFFSEVVTADAGANAGNGKAMIIAVELDDVCVNK